MSRILRLVFVVHAAWAAAAGAGEPGCGPYRVAYYEYGAFYHLDAEGQGRGIDPDVVAELRRRTGCLLDGFLDARARTWAQLADGSLDMTVSGIPSAERERFARFVIYGISRNHVAVARAAQGPRSMAEFGANPALRLAVVKSFRHGAQFDAWIDELRAAGRVDEYSDIETIARVFLAGRADAFLAEPVMWGQLAERFKLAERAVLLDWAPKDEIALGLVLSRARVREADMDRLAAAIAAMRKDGTLERIYARYVTPAQARALAAKP